MTLTAPPVVIAARLPVPVPSASSARVSLLTVVTAADAPIPFDPPTPTPVARLKLSIVFNAESTAAPAPLIAILALRPINAETLFSLRSTVATPDTPFEMPPATATPNVWMSCFADAVPLNDPALLILALSAMREVALPVLSITELATPIALEPLAEIAPDKALAVMSPSAVTETAPPPAFTVVCVVVVPSRLWPTLAVRSSSNTITANDP